MMTNPASGHHGNVMETAPVSAAGTEFVRIGFSTAGENRCRIMVPPLSEA